MQIMFQLFSSWKFLAVAVVMSFILFFISSVGTVNRQYSGPRGAARRKKVKLPKTKKEQPKPAASEEGNEEEIEE